jgi:hypothetical protein
MFASLRALLDGVIDYAGLFPPAQLSLDQAIRSYARYRQEPASWMLGRFVCPAGRLAELVAYREHLLRDGPPFSFTVLARGGKNPLSLYDELLQDLSEIGVFEKELAGRVRIEVMELTLAWARMLTRFHLLNSTSEWREQELTPFCEMVWPSDWRTSVKRFIEDLNKPRIVFDVPDSGERCGFKLRCGGLQASAFPTSDQIAFTIVTCRDSDVPLKFTAGLHHPIRRFDLGLQTHMHGFVNVFGAGVLAHARHLNEERLCAILEDDDPQNFIFDDDGFRWKHIHATTEEIVAARREVVSFGSCSFDEPREDLQKLGWLD